MVLKFRGVWSYVLVVSVVYGRETAINYQYKIKSDPCSNRLFNRRMPCPTFTTTNKKLYDIISDSFSSIDILKHYPYNTNPLRLRIIDSDNVTELSANDFSMYLYKRSTVFVLDLSDNNIQKIHPGSFIAFTENLVELNLAANLLTTLDNTYLSPLQKLQKVNISRNSINTISDTSFENQLDLFVVDLSFNNISHIPKNTFTNQKYLELLFLQGNQIRQFDMNFPKLNGKLSRLDLSYNLLETVSMPEHFTDINLSHNNITVFSLVVSPTFQSLDLSYNYIKTIDPSSFVNAVELYKLNLSHNLLTSIPTSSFKEVKKLHYLDLSHNLIHENSYSSDNNWNSFFLNFKELSQVALDGNYWKCSDLKDFIYLILFNRGQLTPGSTHNTTNIHGIGCINSNNLTTSTNKEITYNPSERIQSLINEQITEEFKNLYLNFTALTTLQTNESQVIMDNLNSVKAEMTKLKMALNSLNTTFIATDMKQKSLNESVKAEVFKLKVALNSLNTTLPNAQNLTLQEDRKTSNDQIMIKMLFDSVKTEISELKETLNSHLTMERTQSSSNAGIIVTNICLLIVICCLLIFFIYVYYKNKHVVKSEHFSEPFESEHFDLD